MSTLAACRADNFYQPPDFDPKNRKKEIEKKRRQGKLKNRQQGARTIRFEMPFHVRCTNCSSMIAKGVRFNAEKKKAGRYLGTIIYQFTMPCTACKNSIIIKTDPENCQYLLVAGVVKYCDEFEQDNDTLKIQKPEEGEMINKNPFFKLETEKIDIIRSEKIKPILKELIREKKIFKDDYYINRTLRRNLKIEKKKINEKLNESLSKGLNLALLDASVEDEKLAKSAKFKAKNGNYFVRDKLRLESIFNNVNCKNKEINSNLFKKNNNVIHSNCNGFLSNRGNNTPSHNCTNGSIVSSIPGGQINNSLNILTLKNNLRFDNLNNKNNLLLQKKHRMDIRIQKSFDTDLLVKQSKSSNMQTSLNLLNNKIRINIKKNDNN